MKALHILTLAVTLAIVTPSAAQQGGLSRSTSSSTFKWVRTVKSQNMKPYSEGLAAFYEAGKWGYENLLGEIVIPAAYEDAGDFRSGMAIVKSDGKWGVIDKEGKIVFECIYDSIEPFSDNTALARAGQASYYLYTDGKSRALPQDLTFYSYHNGIAKVGKTIKGKKKYGYINRKGYFIMEPAFDEASDFFGNTAFVTFKGKSYSINRKGKKSRLNFPLNPANRIYFLPEGNGFIEQAGKYIFVRYREDEYSIQPTRYDMISEYSEGRSLVRTEDGKLMYVNTFGSVLVELPSDCSAAGNFSEGKAWVCYNGKYGFINMKGDLIIDTIFSYTSDFRNGMAYVAYGGRNGIITMAGKDAVYPDMRIENIRLSDNSGNAKVEPGEDFSIEVILKNYGKDMARGISVAMTGKSGQSDGFTYGGNTRMLDSLAAGSTAVLTFEGKAGMEISSDDILLNINALADNQLLPSASSITFRSVGISQCKPQLASYWIHTPKHTPLDPGKPGVVEFAVINEGSDVAKDVTVTMMWPEGMHPADSVMNLGNINPGETKWFKGSFSMDTTVSPSGQYSVVASLKEFTGKHSDIKYFLFETGKMNMEVNLMAGTGASFGTAMPSYYSQMQEIMMETPDGTEYTDKSGLLTGLTQVKNPDINKYALIIGNEDYNSFKQQTLYEPNVDFAVSDAEAFSKYANNILGVPESNIILLKNATYSQMKFNINKLARIANINPGHVELYVYYAGHGQVDGKTNESYLIPVDVSTTSPSEGIRLEDMYATISGSGCKRAMVFLDACYSGMGRGIIIKPKATPVKGNMVVMTASSAIQRSMPYEEKGHGMFTYFLLKELKDCNGDITVERLFNEVKANVQSNSVWINNMEQTPELLSGPGIEEGWQQWKL